MANRVSVTIEIGGTLPAGQIDAFVEIVQAERLSTEWEGAVLTRADLSDGAVLRLMDHEVAWGEVERLEGFCREHGLCYARWCGGYGGEWVPQRVVYTGDGEPATYAASEDDVIVIDQETVDRLGTIAAVRGHFDAANFVVPPLRVE